jgi:hypothetical protein
MNSKISYINDRGALTIAEVDEAVVDDCIIFNDILMVHEYQNPITQKIARLHSIGDAPALIEGPNNRRHWLWHGTLHRTRGPAFMCDNDGVYNQNEEYYAFGVNMSKADFEKYREYLLKVEALAVAHGIDLVDGTRMVGPTAKYALSYLDFYHLIDMAEAGMVPLKNLETGERLVFDLDQMSGEVSKPARGPGLLASAIVGAAAVFLASKVKGEVFARNRQMDEVARQSA